MRHAPKLTIRLPAAACKPHVLREMSHLDFVPLDGGCAVTMSRSDAVKVLHYCTDRGWAPRPTPERHALRVIGRVVLAELVRPTPPAG